MTRPDAPAVLSAEQQLRGPDKSVTAAALVETTTEQEARAVAATLRRMLEPQSHIGVYRLFCMLDKADLERLPTYEPVEYSGPPQGWLPPAGYGLPFAGYVWPLAPASRPEVSAAAREPWEAPRAVSFDKASSVIDRNGDEIGVVEDVRLEPASDRLEGFDVRLGGPLRTLFPGGDVIHLGIRLVDSVEPGLVRLHVAKEALETPDG